MNHEINEEILDKEIRVIGDDGEQLGIMSAEAAMKIAEEKELDLVKISPMAKARASASSSCSTPWPCPRNWRPMY